MRIKSFTLSSIPFNYIIYFPFPEDEREMLENVLSSIDLNTSEEVGKFLDTEMEKNLINRGYISSKSHPEKCRLWMPDFRNEVDFYNPSKKIAIEVEKTEVKRVIHDVLKLVNGSMTFMPKIDYGVLVIPDKYYMPSGKERPFLGRVKKELPFYFQKIIPNNCNLRDILIIAYELDSISG